ncbi:MAG: tRNA pseudouridine(13) synthase TruD, partial [Caldilineaceae bacterium]
QARRFDPPAGGTGPRTPPDSTLPLPYFTADLAGIGGTLRATPEDFVVEEIPLYEPGGEGPHLYVRLTKENLTTREVVEVLERQLALPRGSVGYAGLKDKAARTTQTFSLPVNATPPGIEEEMVARVRSALPVEVHWARLHRNKLKVGHLLGNHFRIRIDGINLNADAALARAEAIAARLRAAGAPNAFGPQRFGGQGDNAQSGYELLTGKRRINDQWLRRFLISSYQSHLCNRVLALRVERGAFTQLLAGDVAKKHLTGGVFDVEDLAIEQPRFEAHEISFTLPLFGSKMRRARDEAGSLESEVEAETGLTDAQWKRARIEGTRRVGRLLLPDLTVQSAPPGSWEASGTVDNQPAANQQVDAASVPEPHAPTALVVAFSLPKGGFATAVLRELMKSDDEPLPAQEVEVES